MVDSQLPKPQNGKCSHVTKSSDKPELSPTRPASTNPVDADIALIEDDGVRRRIAAAFEELRDVAEYGLVFEKHRPESVVLYTQAITEDGYATTREGSGQPGSVFRVISIDDDVATLIPVDEKFRPTSDTEHTAQVETLVPVMVGNPMFPGLIPLEEAFLQGGDKPFHTVINGENFHALEALLYAYEGKVDAIYIDPPFNSGSARLEVQQQLRGQGRPLPALEVAVDDGKASSAGETSHGSRELSPDCRDRREGVFPSRTVTRTNIYGSTDPDGFDYNESERGVDRRRLSASQRIRSTLSCMAARNPRERCCHQSGHRPLAPDPLLSRLQTNQRSCLSMHRRGQNGPR